MASQAEILSLHNCENKPFKEHKDWPLDVN